MSSQTIISICHAKAKVATINAAKRCAWFQITHARRVEPSAFDAEDMANLVGQQFRRAVLEAVPENVTTAQTATQETHFDA